MTASAFDRIVESLDPPLAVVTTAAGGTPAGCLIGFHAQASIDPSRYSFWLSKANHTYRVGAMATSFAVHWLRPCDLDVAEAFGSVSGEDVDKFAGVDYADGPGGQPLLAACPHRMVLTRVALLDDGGDHVCVTTTVVSALCPERFQPLRLSAAVHLVPGRPSSDRVRP